MRQQYSEAQQQQQQQQSASSYGKTKQRLKRLAQNMGLTLFLLLIQVLMYRGVTPSANMDDDNARTLSTVSSNDASKDEDAPSLPVTQQHQRIRKVFNNTKFGGESKSLLSKVLPTGFQAVLRRAKEHKVFCHTQVNQSALTKATSLLLNGTIQAKLPAHGILKALASWNPSRLLASSNETNNKQQWNCQLPPEIECQETQVTAILMAHKPEKIGLMAFNIQQKLFEPTWQALIKEIILVYNGPRALLAKHKVGAKLVWFAKKHPDRFRIFFALEQPGFANHLMNRYHPMLNVTTKGILLYDDDGPFYTHAATLAAFELWKRNANAQVGALGRMLDFSPRQSLERVQQRQKVQMAQYDKTFVSHCPESGDNLEYNYRFFPNFGSQMVLPSSSFLHVNYLCFLWHPALAELRNFVASHPVFPDDIAVSLLVSQLSGRAPRTYPFRFPETSQPNNAKKGSPSNKAKRDGMKGQQSRTQQTSAKSDSAQKQSKSDSKSKFQVTANKQKPRLSKQNEIHSSPKVRRRRRLLHSEDEEEYAEGRSELLEFVGIQESQSQLDPDRQRRRRLLWADVPKEVWAARRSHAANNLVAYFGSISTGGVGWCLGTPYQKGTDTCVPELAQVGMLPWMNVDNTPKSTCP